MKTKLTLKIGLGAILLLSGVAIWMAYVDEHTSRRVHEWRLGADKFFQKDFPPGTVK